VHFKGSGFYATDYGRGSRKSTSKEGEGGQSSDGSGKADKAATTSDAKKPDAKKPD
jgi:predicted nucleic acid-binding Zn ribbon protein